MLPTVYASLPVDPPDPRDERKKPPLSLAHLLLLVRRVRAQPSLLLAYKPHLLSGLLLLALLFVVLRPKKPTYSVEPLRWGAEAQNWGDYVAQGHSRAKTLSATPSSYADLTILSPPLKRGALFVSRRHPPTLPVSKDRLTQPLEADRHGVLGGASVLWSGGVVGSGNWLGRVDMRKRAGEEEEEEEGEESVMTSHILAHGWDYLDAEDEKNTALLLAKALKEGTLAKLPLRDRVRHDPEGRREAAKNWARIYESSVGEAGKSALEVQVEKTVRSAPVVVFSKTTCPHSKRAKELLAKYNLVPAPHIVEVDLRPDGANLKSLLTRLTGHSTFPNIILGSVSIGGADDLAKLEDDGRLVEVLRDSSVFIK